MTVIEAMAVSMVSPAMKRFIELTMPGTFDLPYWVMLRGMY